MFEKTLWGTREKELEAIALLKAHEPPEGYYVAYSGGKDSTVILDLVRRSGVKYDAHYNVTTVDPPELVYHIRQQRDVVFESPKNGMSMWKLIPKKLIPPTRTKRYCCVYLKETGGKGRTVITGVRANESRNRAMRQKIEIDKKDQSKLLIHAIFDWTDTEVWEYIHTHKLDYCKLYDEGFKRLGCICCPLAGPHLRQLEAERWPRYKELYIKAFDAMLKRRWDLGRMTSNSKWQTGESVWDWWISG